MKAHLKTADLVSSLARLKTIAARKATLPVLNCVLIEAHDLGLSLTATDLDSFLTLDIEADAAEAGAVVVPCALLQAAVAKMDGEEIDLLCSNLPGGLAGGLEGKSGGMWFDLVGLDRRDFPPMPKLDGGQARSFAAGALADVLARSVGATSEDATRFVLCGVFITASDGLMQVVATDGRRMAMTSVESTEKAAGLDCIVPTGAAGIMACLDGGGVTELRTLDNHIQASGKGWRLVSKLIEGNFPNWRQVMPPAGAGHRFVVDREKFIDALKFAETFGKTSEIIKLALGKNQLTITASRAEVGSGGAHVDAEVKGGQLVVGFNPAFLLSALTALSGDTITGEIESEISPLRYGDGKTVNVLMPMRVS